MDFDQTQILLGGEPLAGFRCEGRGGDGLEKELGDLLSSIGVHSAVDADDAAEGRDGIAGKGFLECFQDRCAGGRAAGVGVLDDDHSRFIELLGQLPAGVEIDKVVKAKLLALELAGSGNAEGGAVGI